MLITIWISVYCEAEPPRDIRKSISYTTNAYPKSATAPKNARPTPNQVTLTKFRHIIYTLEFFFDDRNLDFVLVTRTIRWPRYKKQSSKIWIPLTVQSRFSNFFVEKHWNKEIYLFNIKIVAKFKNFVSNSTNRARNIWILL